MNKHAIGYGYTPGHTSGNGYRPAYTVAAFCADHSISRTTFYQLIKDGKGPRLMRLGRRVLISAEAAADWRRQMEADTTVFYGGSPAMVVL